MWQPKGNKTKNLIKCVVIFLVRKKANASFSVLCTKSKFKIKNMDNGRFNHYLVNAMNNMDAP